MNALLESGDQNLTNYFEQFSTYEEKLNAAIAITNDELGKQKLLLEQAYISSGQMIYGKISEVVDEGAINVSSLISGNPASLTGDALNAQYKDASTKYLQDKIKNSGLTEEEQLQFIASLDPTASLQQIIEDIDEINAAENLPKFSFEATLTDKSDFTEEQISDILKESDMTESGFNRMAEATFENTDLGSRASEIENEIRALEEQKQAALDAGENIDSYKEKIGDLRQEYQDLGDSTEDITAYNIQMNHGVEDLVNN